MSRLPVPGSDDNTWGEILNDFLQVSHNDDGTVKTDAIADDTSVQQVRVSKDGTLVGTRPEVNFVAGANTTLTVADDSVNNRVDVTVTADLDAVIDSTAASLGLTAQTLQVEQASSTFTLGSGICVFVMIHIPKATVSTLGIWMINEGVTPTGYAGMALYNSDGTLIDQTADMQTILATPPSRWVSGTLSNGPHDLAAGSYYFAFLSHMSSGPNLAGVAAPQNIPVVNGRYPSVYLTGQATFPASFTPASANANSGIYYMTVS